MKIKKLFASLTVALLAFPLLHVSQALAAVDVSIVPASGNVNKNFSIAIAVDTGSDELAGIAFTLTYDTDLTYEGDSEGDMGFSNTVEEDTGSLRVTSFKLCEEGSCFTGQGTLINLSFAATQLGSYTFSISDVDYGVLSAGTVGGATLTVVDGSGEDSDDEGVDELPETGFISDNIFLIIGGVFLVIGVTVAALPESWNLMTLSNILKSKSKQKFENKVRKSVD